MTGHDVPMPYMNMLLDRLNDESALSGGLYVALVTLWTVAIDRKLEIPEELMYPIAEAITQYERTHTPN